MLRPGTFASRAPVRAVLRRAAQALQGSVGDHPPGAKQARLQARERAVEGSARRQPADRAPVAARDLRRSGHRRWRCASMSSATRVRCAAGTRRWRAAWSRPCRARSSRSTRGAAPCATSAPTTRARGRSRSRSSAARRSVLELQASTSRHRVAWTAELSLRDKDGRKLDDRRRRRRQAVPRHVLALEPGVPADLRRVGDHRLRAPARLRGLLSATTGVPASSAARRAGRRAPSRRRAHGASWSRSAPAGRSACGA